MTADARLAPHSAWLSQGDVFKKLLFVRAGVSDSRAAQSLDHSPAMLISHGCAIDKKSNGKMRVEHLSFLPLLSVEALPKDRAALLRSKANELQPYEALYLADVEGVGESYVMLTQPYTLPAALLRPELRTFTAEETGEKEDQRVVATMWDTRVGTLNPECLTLFSQKWNVQWTRMLPKPEAAS